VWSVGNKKQVDIYLGSRALWITQDEQCLRRQKVGGFDEALNALHEWQSQADQSKVRIWLSGGLCRPFVLPDVSGVKDVSELKAIAQSIATSQTGLEGVCDIWLDLPNTPLHRLWSVLGLDSIKPLWRLQGQAMIGAAIQSNTLSALHSALSGGGDVGKGATVVSIAPWWADALRHAVKHSPKPKVLAIQDCDSLTVLVANQPSDGASKPQPGFVRATTFSPVFDPSSVDAALKRWLLSTDLAQEDVLQARLHADTRGLDEQPADKGLVFGAHVQWIGEGL